MQNAMAEFVLKGFSYTDMRYLGIILVWLTLISDLLHLYKFPSTALSSIAVATATPHSFAL